MDLGLNNKVALITGASMGIGFEISKKYIIEGASLVICSRNEQKLILAEKKLKKLLNKNQFIVSVPTDISNSADIDNLFNIIDNNNINIYILINNAGILGLKGLAEEIDWFNWLEVININLLGSVLMCRKILPKFKLNNQGKIIQLSGGGATFPTTFESAYAVSKTGIVRYIEILSKETNGYNIDINAIAPGKIKTRLNKNSKDDNFVSFEKAVNLAVFLGCDKSNGITGKLISAQWDNWEYFSDHLEELKNTDVYTLRRIIGKDRNMYWGDK